MISYNAKFGMSGVFKKVFSGPGLRLYNMFALLLPLFSVVYLSATAKHFVFVVPSYNNFTICNINIYSLLGQKYPNFRLVYIDDASTDGTGKLVEKIIHQYTDDVVVLNGPDPYKADNFFDDYFNRKLDAHKVTLILNPTRNGAAANKYLGGHLCQDDEIYFDCDGDDWLTHADVLSHLNKVYQNPNIWVTYGNYSFPNGQKGGCQAFPKDVLTKGNFRTYDWCTSNPRTFYAKLIKSIKREDFFFEGKFAPAAGDVAFMIPILEMARNKIKFIDEVLYIYNVHTDINDFKLKPTLQVAVESFVRSKPRYKAISKLKFTHCVTRKK